MTYEGILELRPCYAARSKGPPESKQGRGANGHARSAVRASGSSQRTPGLKFPPRLARRVGIRLVVFGGTAVSKFIRA
jgi:hypothetical protein